MDNISECSFLPPKNKATGNLRRAINHYKQYSTGVQKAYSWADAELVSKDGGRFPVHKFMVGRFSPLLEERFRDLAKNSNDDKHRIKIQAPVGVLAIIIAFIYADGLMPKDIWIPDIPDPQDLLVSTMPTGLNDSPPIIYRRSSLYSQGPRDGSPMGRGGASRNQAKSRASSRELRQRSRVRSVDEEISPLQKIEQCVEACLLAKKLGINDFYDMMWPLTIKRMRDRVYDDLPEVCVALRICYDAMPEIDVDVIGVVDTLALQFISLADDENLRRLAFDVPKFGWQLTVRLSKIFQSVQDKWKAKEEEMQNSFRKERAIWTIRHCRCPCCHEVLENQPCEDGCQRCAEGCERCPIAKCSKEKKDGTLVTDEKSCE